MSDTRLLALDLFDKASSNWVQTSGSATVAMCAQAGYWSTAGGALGITSSTSSSQAQEFHRYVPKPGDHDIIYSGWVFHLSDQNLFRIAFYNGLWSGTSSSASDGQWRRTRVRHSVGTLAWEYSDSADGLVSLTTRSLGTAAASASGGRWHEVILGVNYGNNTIDSIMIDDADFTDAVHGAATRSSSGTATWTLNGMIDPAIEFSNTASASAGIFLLDRAWVVSMDAPYRTNATSVNATSEEREQARRRAYAARYLPQTLGRI